jgi:hypothetical protein
MKQFNTFLIAVLALVFSSCSTLLPGYTPNVPFLKEKGDIHLAANGVLGASTKGANVQAAYSPADNFYISTNALWLGQSYLDTKGSSMYELGLGYYGKKEEGLVYEISGGVGFGANKFQDGYKDNITRLYLQAAVGHASEHFEIGGGLKTANNQFRYNGPKEPTNPNSPWVAIWEMDLSPEVWSVEPFFVMRIGGPKVKFNTVFSYPIIVNEAYVVPDPTISLGISVGLGRK